MGQNLILTTQKILNKPKVISFFAGCGGSSLGYKLAGCEVIGSFDWEKTVVDIYRDNFPNTKSFVKDIREVDMYTIKNELGIYPGELDILDGSPPCTPFSIAGSREKKWGLSYQTGADTKAQRSDDLFFEYIRMIHQLTPKIFIAENVRGLIVGKARTMYFDVIVRKMQDLGYNLEVYLVNAANYEVAQNRQRVIIIGRRKDIQTKSNEDLKPVSKPISFLQGISNPPLLIPKNELDFAYKRYNNTSMNSLVSYVKKTKCLASIHPKGNLFNYTKVSYDKPLPTITTSLNLFHPTDKRFLTFSELRRCSSFPDDFKFPSDRIANNIKRLGNCVPPNLMKNIALYIQEKFILS